MNTIVECIPNFSEGRDWEKVERIAGAFRAKENIKLLDYSCDKDHNRMVVTVIGEPAAVRQAVIEAVGIAIDAIDLTKHQGQHPRIGAVDVIPFVPVKNMTLEETDALAKDVGKTVAEQYALPVYLYEQSASAGHRRNLAAIRKGEFEGLVEKMKLPEWKPDFGPETPHSSAGAVVIGARVPLIAFNVNLNTSSWEIADKIARKVRFTGGGLRYCKALGMHLQSRGVVQVSMNLTDYTQTSIYQAVEMVRLEARRYGVSVAGCELIGLIPLQAVVDTAAYYLGLEGFSVKQVLENHC
ncbi:MAG: glutamate formimidoyltransferase [Dysgonamonadaceae bacterium]|jgi:glutamate formiminotransferase|nr:glutamate formimidoyltransferase [Dysgonamonadaceae bacterium]